MDHFVLIFAHAYKNFREASVINNNMASRDNLKKVNKRTHQKMCTDIGLDATGKKKEELVDLLFTNGIPTQNITPVIDQHTSHTGVFPIVDMQGHQLPPFIKCTYVTVPYIQLPSPSFVAIYNFMVAS